MRQIVCFLLLFMSSGQVFSQNFDKVTFYTHRERVKMQIETEMREELEKMGDIEVVPVPLYKIKAKRQNKIGLVPDTASCLGILVRERNVSGIVFKWNNAPYEFLYCNDDFSLVGTLQPVYDTLIIGGKKKAIDVSPLQRMKPINPDSVKIVFGRSYSIKEKLSMALERGEDLFGIYSFLPMPMLNMGIGVVDHDDVLYLKFIYPKPPIVYHDLKPFFDSNYQTIKDYRRLKKFWDRNNFIK